MMVRRTAVLKFGGTSLGDEASREIAMLRVREAVQEGYAVVVVCSAMGRAPSPYATDSLLALTGGTLGGANVDLALAAGEMIAASVFAELLDRNQVPARALSGAQAGIRTDEHFGNANVVRVDPIAVEALLDAGIVPVVAGFQGATEHGDVTTLGRGGTDLSAIALGHAVGAERIDIYTDVSGAMTADPHRINGARRIERAELLEMSELAEHGAKVMHAKAADYAQQTRTPYAIKGLRTGVGTVVEAGVDRHSPVTGVTSTAN
ncbi:MAG: aspartate kinase, partial [Candidatus Eremiobacteraeota bacterium]|nr:aspartate kinase [Candidatus Eremiobacteraeota bacterium]